MAHCIKCDKGGVFLSLSESGLCINCIEDELRNAEGLNAHLRKVADKLIIETTALNSKLEESETLAAKVMSESSKTKSTYESQLNTLKAESSRAISKLTVKSQEIETQIKNLKLNSPKLISQLSMKKIPI